MARFPLLTGKNGFEEHKTKRAPITMCTAALRRGLNEFKRPAVTASENSTSYVKLVGRIQTDDHKTTVCSK